MDEDAEFGPIEGQIRDDIATLGVLDRVRPGLAELAYRLAHDIDGSTEHVAGCECECGPASSDGRVIATLAKELRGILADIAKEAGDDDSAGLGARLSAPVHGSAEPGVPAPVGDGT